MGFFLDLKLIWLFDLGVECQKTYSSSAYFSCAAAKWAATGAKSMMDLEKKRWIIQTPQILRQMALYATSNN